MSAEAPIYIPSRSPTPQPPTLETAQPRTLGEFALLWSRIPDSQLNLGTIGRYVRSSGEILHRLLVEDLAHRDELFQVSTGVLPTYP